MIYVGIDVAKDKHDCFITNQYGEVIKSHFTIANNRKGFNELYRKISSSIKRLVNILFPELETMVCNLNLSSILVLFQEYPGATYIANANLTTLSNSLHKISKGRFDKDFCIKLKSLAKNSIGSILPAVSLELKHTAINIIFLNQEISDIDYHIKQLVDDLNSPILSIPGISYSMASLILGEIGDFSRFDSSDKLLAYAGLSLSIYQSGQLDNCYAKMEKQGSTYLRYVLFNATKYTCFWDNNFKNYINKKRSEGKHYNVAVSHACKKLVRVIFHLVKSNETYKKIA